MGGRGSEQRRWPLTGAADLHHVIRFMREVILERLLSIDEAESTLKAQVAECVSRVHALSSQPITDMTSGFAILKDIRSAAYENLNQFQHEALLLQAVRLFEATTLKGSHVEWFWNPRQTGGADEPDLCAVCQGHAVASVEATTSLKPMGAIGKRLRYTLAKLSGMPGQRYYLVCSEEMRRRACSVVKKGGYDIQILILSTIAPIEEQARSIRAVGERP